ncbi:MAG: transporter substrate-binding domain-containing protein [Alteromonadaceae bacterium]|nr:transporter substrate-binding domain-containing protein [Alteromonadaceae bacterium]
MNMPISMTRHTNLRRHFLWILCCTFLFFSTHHAYAYKQETLLLCVDHYPPLQIIQPNGQVTGENVEVAKAFAKAANYRLEFTPNTPFKRCLQWLKQGKVDMMVGLLNSQERDQTLNMFLYDKETVKTVFLSQSAADVTTLDDLKGKRVGLVRGVKQFEAFDHRKEQDFELIYVNNLESAFGMLAKKRVEAVICTDYYGHNILRQNPAYSSQIRQASFEVTQGTEVYIGISKRANVKNIDKFNEIAEDMLRTKQFRQIMDEFKRTHPQYY